MLLYTPPLVHVFQLGFLNKHRENFASIFLNGIKLKIKNKEFSRSKFTVLKTDKSAYFFFLFFLFTLFFYSVYLFESKLLSNTRIMNY